MNSLFKKLLLLTLSSSVLSLASCGLIKDRSGEYIHEKADSSLILPPGYESAKIRDTHPIPEIKSQTQLSEDVVIPKPPETATIPPEDLYKVASLDNQNWLIAQDPPGRFWPKLHRFLEMKGIGIAEDLPKSGTLKTDDWRNGKKSSIFAKTLLTQVKLDGNEVLSAQFVVKQGIKRNTSELRVKVITSQKLSNEQASQLEKTLLDELVVFLKSDDADTGYSLLANDLGDSSKVSMSEDKLGEPYLRLELDFDRAWSSTQTALTEADFKILDINRSRGLFYVFYKKPKSRSWFYWLWPEDKQSEVEFNAIIGLEKLDDNLVIMKVTKIQNDLEKTDKAEILSLILKNLN